MDKIKEEDGTVTYTDDRWAEVKAFKHKFIIGLDTDDKGICKLGYAVDKIPIHLLIDAMLSMIHKFTGYYEAELSMYREKEDLK